MSRLSEATTGVPYASAYGSKADINGGVSGLESRLQMMEQEIEGCYENLNQLMNRLYPPHPQPAQVAGDGAISASIENGMNRVISKLQELRRLSHSLLNG